MTVRFRSIAKQLTKKYKTFIFASGHYCILLKEFVMYTHFAITPRVENTFM